MANIHKGRFAAEIDGDFVVFQIGMRINHLLLLHKWIPVVMAMPRMIRELYGNRELGLLSARTYVSGRVILVVQYWRSFEQLHAYAHAQEKEHLPAWREFNRRIDGNGSVGIFHETYLVAAGKYESVYVNTPKIGLGLAGRIVPATGQRQSAATRLGRMEAE